MKRAYEHPLLPADPQHDRLVRAILAPDREADEAYRRWREGVDVFTLDGPSTTLLAPLARRLGSRADDEIAQQLAKVARMTWLRGNMLSALVAPVLETLAKADVPVMVAKGAAVLHHAGLDLGARPMLDVDVCVPLDKVRRATRILNKAGFCSELDPVLAHRPRTLAKSIHAVGFYGESGAQIDLHWHLLGTSLHPRADDLAWADAVAATWREVPILVTSREDTLVHVLVHGSRYNTEPALRWTTDAALLVNSGEMDWGTVLQRAAHHRVGDVLAEGLGYLAEMGAVSVPADVLHDLRQIRPSLTAQAVHRAGQFPSAPGRAGRDLARALAVQVPPGRDVGPRDVARALRAEYRAFVAPVRRPVEPVRLGVPASCVVRPDGKGADQLVAGWHYPESHGTWSSGRRARILMPLAEPTDAPLLFEAELIALVTIARPTMEVDVVVDGKRIARWSFAGTSLRPERRSAWIEPKPGRSAVDVILKIRSPLTGVEARTIGDERALGVAARWVSVRDATLV